MEEEVPPRLVDWLTEQLCQQIPEMAASAAEVTLDDKFRAMVMSQSQSLLNSWLFPQASPNPIMALIDQNIRSQLGLAQTGQPPPL